MDVEIIVAPKESSINIFNAILLIINAEVGAGILNFPEAFKRAGGVYCAFALQLTFLCFTTVSLIILNIVSAKYKTETMGELCFQSGGLSLGICSSTIITIYGMFSLTAYMVVIADNWDLVLFTLDRERFCDGVWYYNRTFTVVMSSLFIILPNCFPKRVGYLKYAARVGVFGIFYIAILINVYGLLLESTPGHIRSVPENLLEFVSALPTFCYAYHCHVQSVPVFHSLYNNTWPRILLVAVIGNTVSLTLLSSVGASGYLAFGDDVFENIMHNYDGKDPPVVIAIIFLLIKICCTYPVILFVTRKEMIWLYNFATNDQPQNNELKKRVIVVLFIFSVSIIMATIVNTVGVAFGFTGTFIALYLFFFPGLTMLLSLRADEEKKAHYKKMLVLASFFIVLGAMQFSLSMGLTIMRTVNAKMDPPKYLCDEP